MMETHMDYSGQKLAEQIFQRIIIFFSIVGFFVGYVNEQLSYSMYVLGIGCVIAGLVTLPPWSMYRKDPINWQTPQTEEETITAAAPKNKSKKRN